MSGIKKPFPLIAKDNHNRDLMFGIDILLQAVMTEIGRAVTGRLFNDEQIQAVAKSSFGKYFSDWLPQPVDERTA